MPSQTQTLDRPIVFTDAEKVALCHLRTRYAQSGDDLSERELAHLRFVRWLYRRGRLDG
jgi:hypothetical protein